MFRSILPVVPTECNVLIVCRQHNDKEWKFKEQHAKMWENIAGAIRYSVPRGRGFNIAGASAPVAPAIQTPLAICVITNKHDDDDDDDDACDVMLCRQQPAAAALLPTSDPRVGAPLEFWRKRRKTDHNHRSQRQHVAGRPKSSTGALSDRLTSDNLHLTNKRREKVKKVNKNSNCSDRPCRTDQIKSFILYGTNTCWIHTITIKYKY